MKRLVLTAIVKTGDSIKVRVKEAVPYKPGLYDFGCEYPFIKNVWLNEFDGYYMGRIVINNDLSIDYLNEHFLIPCGCTVTIERRFIRTTIFIIIQVEEIPD